MRGNLTDNTEVTSQFANRTEITTCGTNFFVAEIYNATSAKWRHILVYLIIYSHVYVFFLCTSYAKDFQDARRLNIVLVIHQLKINDITATSPGSRQHSTMHIYDGATEPARKLFWHGPVNLVPFGQ